MKLSLAKLNQMKVRSAWLALLLFFAIPSFGQGLADLSKPIYVKWSYKAEGVTNLTPAADGERIYLPLTDGSIISVWLNDGRLSWRSEVGGVISASPVVDEKSVYVASESLPSPKSLYPQATGVLRALSRQSGLTSWMRTLPSPVRGVINVSANHLFASSADGRLYAIKKETGEITWLKYNSSPFSFLHSLEGETLYINDAAGDIIAIELVGGQTLWRYRTRKSLRAPVAVSANIVYTGTADGYVFAIDRLSGRNRWRVRTGAAVQSVRATEKCILATSLDNFIYCLSPQNGAKLWKRQLAGRVAAPPLVFNGSVLLAPLVGDECVILNLEDGKKVNSIYVGEDNNTEAAPLLASDTLLLTTREGLLALSNQTLTRQADGTP
ncbi:MAG TPA: PQQ-binding-like beta-propeller repeat protein [Pyrinomonadaceae bacterium]